MSTPVLPDVATNELVAQAWLIQFMGRIVAPNLPALDVWSSSGFVQITTTGGTPNMDVPMHQPVITCDCWAASPGANRPPWGMAASLAEVVKAAAMDPANCQMMVTLPRQLGQVRVHTVWPLKEPQRVPNDPAGYARYTLDLAMVWTTS